MAGKFKVIKNLFTSSKKVAPSVSKNIHRGHKTAGPITKQKQTWLQKNKGKVGSGAALVGGGAIAGTASDNVFGKGGRSEQGNINVVVQKKFYNVKHTR